MLGFVKAYKPEMKMKDYEIYREYIVLCAKHSENITVFFQE